MDSTSTPAQQVPVPTTPAEQAAAQAASTQAQLDLLTGKLDAYAAGQATVQASIEARFQQGDDKFAEVMTMLTSGFANAQQATEQRISMNESRLAEALSAVAAAVAQLQDAAQASAAQSATAHAAAAQATAQAQQTASAAAAQAAALTNVVAAAPLASSAGGNNPPGLAASGLQPQAPVAAFSATAPFGPGPPATSTPSTSSTPAVAAAAAAAAADPWAAAAAAAAAGAAAARASGSAPAGRTDYFDIGGDLGHREVSLKSKDFAHIERFDGSLSLFPDWADRMAAKFRRAHPRLGPMLAWAEAYPDQITEAVEIEVREPGVNTVAISEALYDIIMERTGTTLFAKRRNAGEGRGLEFWRILKRDFGMSSTDARLARLQMYMKPARATTLAELGPALDRWEALGNELGRAVDDEFRLLALRDLVPKDMAAIMLSQTALRAFPEALMYVRRQVADHRHATQVSEVQRQQKQGPAPMDVSALLAAIEHLRTGGGSQSSTDETAAQAEAAAAAFDADNPYDQVIAALKGKGKGWCKGGGKGDTRECWECGQKGHLARHCPSKANPKGQPKGLGKGNKGKGKSLAAFFEGGSEDNYDEAISLGCLVRAPPPLALAAGKGPQSQRALCPQAPVAPVTWNGLTKVVATIDSGAAECVCGVGHFESVAMLTGEDRPNAGVEYVCADGGRIPNIGEKHVKGLTTDGLKLNVNFQVTPVDRPLISVGKLTKAGHKVVFGMNGGTITHNRSGAVTPFRRENGVYVLDLWVPSVSGGIRQ